MASASDVISSSDAWSTHCRSSMAITSGRRRLCWRMSCRILGELVEQARLPDPRLTHDADELAATPRRDGEPVPEVLEVSLAPREGNQAAAGLEERPLRAGEPVPLGALARHATRRDEVEP